MSLDDTTGLVKQQKHTRDAFLGGRLTLSQPRHGFRAGLDSVLLGAAVSCGRSSLLDLGAGVGTAGLVALALNPDLVAMLAERDGDGVRIVWRGEGYAAVSDPTVTTNQGSAQVTMGAPA